ncbi:MAG: dihydrodipicolinate synthase family protein [Chloroflexi bacterium]|nr:dihydrodipicolinate synthase family protein [Chloroflexota bacterium]
MAGGALTQAKTAAHRFLNDLGPQDTVAIVAFGNAVVPLLAFTTDRAAAGAAIDGLTASGSTALYDATVASIRLAANSGNSRFAVVLLTDGVDDGSLFSRADALTTAQALGVPVYSSAVFNFIPKTAVEFYQAIAKEDHDTVGKLIDDFFLPYLAIRNRKAGYAVSIVKAGAKIVGHDAGPVRTPLTDCTPEEQEELAALIKKLGPQ